MINNKINIFDLSCIIFDGKNMVECYQSLVNKLKKNGCIINNNKTNKIKCSKGNINFEIDILKINTNDDENDNKSENKDIFYCKIDNKKGGIAANQMISKILFS